MTSQSANESTNEWKPTLLDRLGPDAGRFTMLRGYMVITFPLSLFLFWMLSGRMAFTVPLARYLFVIVGGALCAAGLASIVIRVSNMAGSGMQVLTMGAAGSPYQDQFSLEQAMVMRGEVDQALASFEERIAQRASGVDVRVRAAELYAKEGKNPVRAAALLREARTLPGITEGQDIYVTNRLADLLAGPLEEHGRALVELRRLIERYPGTPAASHARSAISAIKRL
jgi:hypothetical protein